MEVIYNYMLETNYVPKYILIIIIIVIVIGLLRGITLLWTVGKFLPVDTVSLQGDLNFHQQRCKIHKPRIYVTTFWLILSALE